MIFATARDPERFTHTDGVVAPGSDVFQKSHARASSRMQAVCEMDDVSVFTASRSQQRSLQWEYFGAASTHTDNRTINFDRQGFELRDVVLMKD